MRSRTLALLSACALVVLLAGVGVGIRLTRPHPCAPLRAVSVRPDHALARSFTDYATNPGEAVADRDNWTGGDGTHSVLLPDGRTLWLFDDTFLGPVNPPDLSHPTTWRPDTAPGLANSAVLQEPRSSGGVLTRTLHGGSAHRPTSWIPGEHRGGRWSWPTAAVVDTDGTNRVLRVFAHRTAGSHGPFIYGVGLRTQVLTYSLPDLRPAGRASLSSPGSPGRRVLYGQSVLRVDGNFYVYGNNTPVTGRAHLYLARVPVGHVGIPADWRYRAGDDWVDSPGDARPLGRVRHGHDGQPAAVSTGYSVVRRGGTYVLFTMNPYVKGGTISQIATYWGCSASGPWHGPTQAYAPPESNRPGTTVMTYNPQVHPGLGAGRGLVLSYDVNDADPTNGLRNVHNDASIYRPRFLHVLLAQRGPSPTTPGLRP